MKGQDNPEFKKYLLLDNRIIQKTENVKLEVGKVVKHPNNPLFGEEKDWEIQFNNFYGNVIFDEEENIYKCWYGSFILGPSAKGMTLEQREKALLVPTKKEVALLYATSKDGIHWEKPNLGLVEYKGSKENNILIKGIPGGGVFKDLKEEDTTKRFKLITYGLSVIFSSDGINWNDIIVANGVKARSSTHNNAFWAPNLNKYVGIIRSHTFGEYGREVARIESDDFINWTNWIW